LARQSSDPNDAHHAVNNRMLAKQNHLARCARDDLLDLGLRRTVRAFALQRPVRQLDHPSLTVLDDPLKPGTSAHSLVDDANRSCFEQGSLEVVDQVGRVLDTDAETDEVLGEVASGTDSRVDRGVAVRRRLSASQHDDCESRRTT
jgi:hypothetical protein